jgi:hypothetical protein
MKWKMLIPVMLLLVVGCDDTSVQPDADTKMTRQTEQAMREANAQIGMPAIKNFQERKLAKMIFELRDQEDLICWAYLKNEYSGKLVFLGKCVGFGLPYSVQYTNPERIAKWYSSHQGGGGGLTLPQPDPNGLFMPEGLSATWLMMIDPKGGKPRPVYVEPEIVVSPFPLHQE